MVKLATLNEIDQGIYPDLPGEVNPFWESGQNAIFEKGYVRPAFGATLVGEVPGEIPVSFGQLFDSAARGFIGTQSRLYTFTDPTSIYLTTADAKGSGYTGDAGDFWNFAPFDDWMLASNGVNTPQIWKGVSFAALGGTPPTYAKVLITRAPYVIAGYTDNGPTVLEWCDFDDPEDWVPTSTNDADSTSLKGARSEITAAELLTGEPMIYTKDAQFYMPFKGRPFIFDPYETNNEIGVVGPGALCSVGNTHYGFGQKGIWLSDGGSHEYFDNSLARGYIYEDLNEDYQDLIRVAHFKSEHSVVFSWPAAGQTRNTKSIAFDYQNKKFTPLGYAFTAALTQKVFKKEVAGFYTGVLVNLGAQTSPFYYPTFGFGGDADYGFGEGGHGGYDSSTYGAVTLTSKPLDLGNDEFMKKLESIVTAIEGSCPNATIEIGYADRVNATFTFAAAQSLAEGPLYWGNTLQDARYFKIRVTDTQATVRYKLSKFTIFGEVSHAVP